MFYCHVAVELTMLQSLGLPCIHLFYDSVEVRNITASPTSKDLNTTQGTNATFNAYMAAIAEVEDGGDKSPSDAVCLPLPSAYSALLELNAWQPAIRTYGLSSAKG